MPFVRGALRGGQESALATGPENPGAGCFHSGLHGPRRETTFRSHVSEGQFPPGQGSAYRLAKWLRTLVPLMSQGDVLLQHTRLHPPPARSSDVSYG